MIKYETLFFKSGIDFPYMFQIYKHKYAPDNKINDNIYYCKYCKSAYIKGIPTGKY